MGRIIGTRDKQRLTKMREMHESGMTYQAIADEFGVTQQRVHQIIGSRNVAHFNYVTKDRCIFEGLRNWMNENEVCVAELTRRVYHNGQPTNRERIRKKLMGNQATIEFVDRILNVTGLTYEEAFRREQ